MKLLQDSHCFHHSRNCPSNCRQIPKYLKAGGFVVTYAWALITLKKEGFVSLCQLKRTSTPKPCCINVNAHKRLILFFFLAHWSCQTAKQTNKLLKVNRATGVVLPFTRERAKTSAETDFRVTIVVRLYRPLGVTRVTLIISREGVNNEIIIISSSNITIFSRL